MGHLIVSDVGRAEAKHTHVDVSGSLFGKDIKPRGYQGSVYSLDVRSQCRFPCCIDEKIPRGKRKYCFVGRFTCRSKRNEQGKSAELLYKRASDPYEVKCFSAMAAKLWKCGSSAIGALRVSLLPDSR